ncbi:MAG: YwaF family protein [Bacilli bacterium]|nr:YwaF family protein [Bacilli bacterium]
MNWFERIVYALQFEVNRPSTFGLFHFVWLVLSILMIIYLYKKKHDEKILKKVLLIYGFGSFILELLKQIVWSFNYDVVSGIVSWDYQWYAFPFQLCTTPIFVCIICGFLNKGKVRDCLLNYVAFVTILGSIATAIYPESCFVSTLLINIHTMYLHFGSLVVSFYLLFKEVNINFKSLISGYFVFIVFVLIAQVMNVCVYNSGILNGEVFNMFYISPYFTSSLPLYDVVQKNSPYVIYFLFYLITIFLGSLIVFLISKYFSERKSL